MSTKTMAQKRAELLARKIPAPMPQAAPGTVPADMVSAADYDKLRRMLAEERTKSSAQFAAQTKELDGLKGKLEKSAADSRSEKIRSAAMAAAGKFAAPDAIEDVVELIASRLQMNDAGLIVSREDPTQDSETYVKAYLDKKPHLAAARVAQGSGAKLTPVDAPTPPTPQTHDTTTAAGATAALHDRIRVLTGAN